MRLPVGAFLVIGGFLYVFLCSKNHHFLGMELGIYYVQQIMSAVFQN